MELAATSIFVVAAVAGATELIRRAYSSDWQGVTLITTAAVIGLLAGVFGVDDLTPFTGIVAGLSASGLITFAQKFGHDTSPIATKRV